MSEAFRTWTFKLCVVGSVVLETFSLAGASTFVFVFGCHWIVASKDIQFRCRGAGAVVKDVSYP